MKNRVLPGKDGFGKESQLFPSLGKTKKNKNKKKKSFGRLCGQSPKYCFLSSLGKSWFSFPKPSFSWEKLVLHAKTIFFLGKSWFSTPKPCFSAQNHLFPRKKLAFLSKTILFPGKTKRTIFWESGRIVSQKIVFLVFPRKSWFSFPKPSFS